MLGILQLHKVPTEFVREKINLLRGKTWIIQGKTFLVVYFWEDSPRLSNIWGTGLFASIYFLDVKRGKATIHIDKYLSFFVQLDDQQRKCTDG
jgi:hypothetical protein